MRKFKSSSLSSTYHILPPKIFKLWIILFFFLLKLDNGDLCMAPYRVRPFLLVIFIQLMF